MDEIHLLDVETHRHRRFLKNTCISILDWR